VTIRLGLKNEFLFFKSQISHKSRKREAGRPFGPGPTLKQMRLEDVVVDTPVLVGNTSHCAATNRSRFWDKISIWRKGSLKYCFPYEYVNNGSMTLLLISAPILD